MIQIPGMGAPAPVAIPRPAAGAKGAGDYDNLFK